MLRDCWPGGEQGEPGERGPLSGGGRPTRGARGPGPVIQRREADLSEQIRLFNAFRFLIRDQLDLTVFTEIGTIGLKRRNEI